MTIKFDRLSGNEWVSVPDSAATVFPDNSWSLGFILVVDGSYNGVESETIFSTGLFTPGNLNISYLGPGHSTPNRVGVQVGSTTAIKTGGDGLMTPGTQWMVVLQRDDAGNLKFRCCPILSSAPADGLAVTTYDIFSVHMAGVHDGTSGITIGARSDKAANRMLDRSISRVFRINGSLTAHEIARLAYGETVVSLNKSPVYYFRMDNAGDLAGLGSAGLTLTPSGTLSAGTAPSFGHIDGAPAAPVFTSAPSITGTANVGVAKSFTSGVVTGNPPPTVTRQWQLQDDDIPGATGETYTPIDADVGKTLTIKQTATNAQSPGGVTSVSNGVAVAAAPVYAYSVTDPTSRRIFQRIGTSATITFTGGYVAAPASVEAQLYAVDGTTVLQAWTPMTGLVNEANVWTASLVAQQGGMYRIAVRFKDAAGAVINTTAVGANRWGVGAIIMCAGDSISSAWFRTGSYTPSANISKYSGWAWSSFGALGTTNGPAVLFANGLSTRLGVPVAMVDIGASGSRLFEWNNPDNSYRISFMNALAVVGGKLEAVMFSIGSNDAGNGSVGSRASHLNNLRTFISTVRTATAQPDLKWLHVGFNRRELGANSLLGEYVRMAENDLGDDPNCYHIQTLDFELGSDNVHLTGAGYEASIIRAEAVFGSVLAGGAYRRGPRITALNWSGSSVTATAIHRGGSDITPASGITGLVVTDADTSGVALTIMAGVRLSANQVRWTFNRPLVGPVVAKYLPGGAPVVGTPVYDNGTPVLPMHVETQLAATEAAVEPTPPDTAPPTFELGATLSVTPGETVATLSGPAATDSVGVTGYEYSINGGTTYVAIPNGGRSASITGLTPATDYAARFRAVDAADNKSAPLEASFTTTAVVVEPEPVITVPGKPTITSIVAGDGIVTVSFAPPADNGGAPITQYQLSLSNGASSLWTSSPITVSAPNGVPVVATLRAINSEGPGLASDQSASVTPMATSGEIIPVNFSPSVSRTIKILVGKIPYDVGTFWTISGITGPVGVKDPNATIDIHFDWTQWLGDIGNVQLADVFFILGGGLESQGAVATGSGGTVFVSGGVLNTDCTITCRITTNTVPARIEDRTAVLRIRDQ